MNLTITGLRLAAESAIDLHLHTIYSDGDWEPEQLLDHLQLEGFALAAVCDHDRTDTIAHIQQLAMDLQLPMLTAVEMTTTWQGEMTDLLCYGFDPGHTALDKLAQDVMRRQQENTREVCETCSGRAALSPPMPCRPSWLSPARSSRMHWSPC